MSQDPSPEPPNPEAREVPTSFLIIDGTNLDHRVMEGFGRLNLNYDKFFHKIATKTRLQKVFYCVAPYKREANEALYKAQTSTLNYMNTRKGLVEIERGRHKEIVVRCGRKTCSYEYKKYVEKRTDVHVAARLVQAACRRSAQNLIVISNDTDYAPAMAIAREEGARLRYAYVVSPHLSPSQRTQLRYDLDTLRKLAHETIEIDADWLRDCWR
jgi:uncharacterized LabA/DUF88 family protein